jgi:hypothetical protein
MLRSTFAEEILGLNIQRNRNLKRLCRDIFKSGRSNSGLSVLSADVDWKCKLFFSRRNVHELVTSLFELSTLDGK